MNITVLGYTEKRYIIYPLLKCLRQRGKVALFSNNRAFTRLTEGNLEVGYVNDIFIAVTEYTPDEIFNELELDIDEFKFVIFDTTNTIPEQSDVIIYARGMDYEDGEKELLDSLNNVYNYKIAYSLVNERGCFNIRPDKELFKYIETVESKKIFPPICSNVVNDSLSDILCNKMNMSKREIKSLLTKGWKK